MVCTAFKGSKEETLAGQTGVVFSDFDLFWAASCSCGSVRYASNEGDDL